MKTSSIMTVPIIGVSYKVKKQTTICRIKWTNPATGNIQVTCGIATCNPDDKFDEQIGQRLAESRAKYNLYQTYIHYLGKIYKAAVEKHLDLKYAENMHRKLIQPRKEDFSL